MTTIDKAEWHRWLDESGQELEIPAFYYEDGDEVRIQLVEVALGMEFLPDVMQAFLNRFCPDAEDIKAALDACAKHIDVPARAILQQWISDAAEDRLVFEPDGFPILPPAPKDPINGKHWGMRNAIGWSNPVNCPDASILWHVLARGNRELIKEAIGYYGLRRVQVFWERMKQVAPVKKIPTIHSHRNGELIESAIGDVDEILASISEGK